MKTLKLISIIIILFLASCRSREMSFGRSKTSETVKEKISVNESHSVTIDGVRVVETRDSSKQFVGMRIYPLDTFSLSVSDGFRGLARVVEYWGVKEGVKERKDTSAVATKKEYSGGYVGEMEIRKDEVLKGREVRKESMILAAWIVVLVSGLYFVWMGLKRRVNRLH